MGPIAEQPPAEESQAAEEAAEVAAEEVAEPTGDEPADEAASAEAAEPADSEHMDDHDDIEDHDMVDDDDAEHGDDEDTEHSDNDDEGDDIVLLTDADASPRSLSEHKLALLGAAGLVTFVAGVAVSLQRRSAAVSDPTLEMGERC